MPTAFAHAFHYTYLVLMWLALLGIVIGLTLSKVKFGPGEGSSPAGGTKSKSDEATPVVIAEM